jgi:hypothetical protein
VVIHGIGDHFSSGLDLSELTEQDATEGLRHSQMWHRVFDRIQYSRVPVIAALKGAVIGGGPGACLRGAYPRRRTVGLFRAARGPARHLRRRRRIGAAAAADRRGADDRHDADGPGLFGDRRLGLRFLAISHEAGGALPKALELAERVAPMRR